MSNPIANCAEGHPAGTFRPSYDVEHFQPLFAVEDHHFWFRSRNRCIAAATRLIPRGTSIQDIIEHGCGTGFVLAELKRLFPRARVVGADLFAEGLVLARRRFAGPLVQTDILQSGYRAAFDLVGLFDVLEHLDNDLQVLNVIREQLRPGGCLLMTVPAHMALWSEYDVASGHRRRYARNELLSRLTEAGFEVRFCSEFMSVLFPLMWVRRRLSWKKTSPQTTAPIERELHVNPVLNSVLEKVLRLEAWWISHGRKLPCGTSLLALAIKG
jgi:SAM-dependent methyltransferase